MLSIQLLTFRKDFSHERSYNSKTPSAFLKYACGILRNLIMSRKQNINQFEAQILDSRHHLYDAKSNLYLITSNEHISKKEISRYVPTPIHLEYLVQWETLEL